ncbi:MAG: hypothetical protein QOG87_3081 [Actinomycetota bacterium]|jgi:Ser/Thr protein kinase RdoA (MazF antagonist)
MTASVISEQMAGLDPRLPGLDELFDTRRAAALFAQIWRSEIMDCRLLGTRYEPGVSCVATYEIAPRDIGVVELTPDGCGVRSYVDDPGLPGLAEAADPDAVALLLDGAVDVRQCSVTPVRYVPGQRAVLRYDVDTPSGPVVLYAKVVRAGVTALATAFTELHRRARSGFGPFVPDPTVVHEGIELLVLPAVEGRSLHALAFDPALSPLQRADAFRATGRAVARLHAGPPPATTVTSADDVSALDRSVDALRAIDPALAERWDGVLAELASMEVAPAPVVPSHGALRTDQIVMAPDGPALLDLDGYCAAPAACDLGNLLAYLRWRAMRRPDDAEMAALGREAMLTGYEELAPAPHIDVARYEGLSLLKIAARRYRNLNATEWPLVPDLVDAAGSLARSGS